MTKLFSSQKSDATGNKMSFHINSFIFTDTKLLLWVQKNQDDKSKSFVSQNSKTLISKNQRKFFLI